MFATKLTLILLGALLYLAVTGYWFIWLEPDLPSTGQQIIQNPMAPMHPDFSVMQAQWTPLTLLHNSLNRSLGHEDAYPFAIASATWDKLRFVHEVVCNYRQQLQISSPQISNPQTSSLPT